MITPKRLLGNKGEDIACDFLINNGFRIIGRNVSNKLGEIDIVAKRNKTLHFIEVKSGISYLLTEEEKHIKNLIVAGRVNFRLIKVTEEEIAKFVTARKEE